MKLKYANISVGERVDRGEGRSSTYSSALLLGRTYSTQDTAYSLKAPRVGRQWGVNTHIAGWTFDTVRNFVLHSLKSRKEAAMRWFFHNIWNRYVTRLKEVGQGKMKVDKYLISQICKAMVLLIDSSIQSDLLVTREIFHSRRTGNIKLTNFQC